MSFFHGLGMFIFNMSALIFGSIVAYFIINQVMKDISFSSLGNLISFKNNKINFDDFENIIEKKSKVTTEIDSSYISYLWLTSMTAMTGAQRHGTPRISWGFSMPVKFVVTNPNYGEGPPQP